MNIASMVRRLIGHWERSSNDIRDTGINWYPVARRTVAEMATKYGVTHRCAAGVVAALSPRLHWSRNITVADMVLAREENVPGCFRANLRKARAIREGAKPSRVLSGPKVRAFYRALVGDDSAAVIDVWTVRAAGWVTSLTEQAYAKVARALEIAASKVRTSVAALQAVAWVAVRGRAA